MTTPIQLLPQDEFNVFKIIRIEGPEWNQFTGHLINLRTFNPKTYDSKKGDPLDEKINTDIQKNIHRPHLVIVTRFYSKENQSII